MPFHHILFAFTASIVWGVNFVVMKIGLEHLSPFLFMTFRFAIIIIFTATLLYSVGAILMRKLQNVGVFNTQAWTAVIGIPILLSLSLYAETGHMDQIMNVNLEGWSAIFYTAVLSSVVGYGGMNFLLKRHPVTLIAPIFLSVPVFATAAAVIVFDEVLTMRFLVGAGLTLCGLAVIHMRDWWKKRQVVRELLP